MSDAPDSVVRAVMEALGCCKVSVDPDPTLARPWCEQHEGWWDDRGCPEALLAADAAWVASLEAAADRCDVEAGENRVTALTVDSEAISSHHRKQADEWLRCGETLLRWAGEQERGEEC